MYYPCTVERDLQMNCTVLSRLTLTVGDLRVSGEIDCLALYN